MATNMVVLHGFLGKDPELRYTTTGKSVASFSLATSEKYVVNGQEKETTQWTNIVCWGKLAEAAGDKLHKGSQVVVLGKLQTRSWDDTQTGQKRYATEVVASLVGYSLGQASEPSVAKEESGAPAAPAPTKDDDDLPF